MWLPNALTSGVIGVKGALTRTRMKSSPTVQSLPLPRLLFWTVP